MGAGWNLRNVYFKAVGKYFKWATHDDMIQPDFLRLCIDALEADDSLVVAHTLTRCIDESGQFIESNDERLRTSSLDPVVRARDLLLKDHGGYPISGLIRLDALRKLPPRGSFAHSDRVLLLQLGLLGRFYEVPEHLSICTKHTVEAVSPLAETKPQTCLCGMECGEGVRSFRSPLSAEQGTTAQMLWRDRALGVVQSAEPACNSGHTRTSGLARSQPARRGIHMKVAILAGTIGSCLAEDTELKPKTMVEIGGKPILWHILMHYAHYGHEEFVIALGHKGEVIKKYMLDYCSLNRDLSVSLKTGRVRMNGGAVPDWMVELVDTGMKTETGGRIKRLAPYLGGETFMVAWGDGVADINLHDLLAFHRSHGKLATLTAVRPTARFGHLELEDDRIVEVSSRPQTREGWINGAFFVLEPEVLDFIDGDGTHFEKEPLERLAAAGQLMAYRHSAFWQCMDTLREKRYLESLWETGQAPWKTWSDAMMSPGRSYRTTTVGVGSGT